MTQKPGSSIHFVAGLIALAFPGAGHFFVLGERQRGFFAAVGVLGLFFGGLLVGGISVVDREEDKYWFLGQALIGPIAFGVNTIHQNSYKAYEVPPEIIEFQKVDAKVANSFVRRSLHPDEELKDVEMTILQPTGAEVTTRMPVAVPAGPGGGPPAYQSIGRMNELGMLSSTLGGMLNFIIILDALFPTRRRKQA